MRAGFLFDSLPIVEQSSKKSLPDLLISGCPAVGFASPPADEQTKKTASSVRTVSGRMEPPSVGPFYFRFRGADIPVCPAQTKWFDARWQPLNWKSGCQSVGRSNRLCLNEQSYCLSETTTLSTSCPSASLPLKVEVRVFPSLETFEVTVIITWPPFFRVDSIVSAPTRLTETVSA